MKMIFKCGMMAVAAFAGTFVAIAVSKKIEALSCSQKETEDEFCCNCCAEECECESCSCKTCSVHDDCVKDSEEEVTENERFRNFCKGDCDSCSCNECPASDECEERGSE